MPIIVCYKYGQLGNRLYLFARLIACAIEHNCGVLNPSFAEYSQLFESTSTDLLCRYPPRQSSLKHTRVGQWLGSVIARAAYLSVRIPDKLGFRPRGLRALSAHNPRTPVDLGSDGARCLFGPKRVLLVRGLHFAYEAGLHRCADQIRQYFRPRTEYRRRIDRLVSEIRPHCDILVGVHVRRSDYARYYNGKYYYSVDVYARLMRQMLKLLSGKRVAFLICSDENLDLSSFAPLTVFRGNGHVLEDMYALAECDFVIGPPSSFSSWASFYGNVPICFIRTADMNLALNEFYVQWAEGT